MIEETYDQSRLDNVPEPKFVGQEHAAFERLLKEVADKQEADRAVVSPTALTILLSSDAGGFHRVSGGNVAFNVGSIGGLPIDIDPNLNADAPTVLYKDGVEVGKVFVVSETLRFI